MSSHDHPITIVLAEDDDGHATLVSKNLERAGVTNPIVRFTNGAEALSYIQNEALSPHPKSLLLLADIKMPVMDGLELLRNLREEPATRNIPVLMLTTTDDPREVENCYKLGCNVYIVKPVSYEAFVEAMRRLGLFLQVVQIPAPSKSSS